MWRVRVWGRGRRGMVSVVEGARAPLERGERLGE